MHPPFYDVTSRRQWLNLKVNGYCVPEYLFRQYYPKKGNSCMDLRLVMKKNNKISTKMKNSLFTDTINEILKPRI